MKVKIEGSKKIINLASDDFIEKGGQAIVYGKDGVVFKIYHDPNSMIPGAKIEELSKLDRSNILKPEKILYDTNKTVIGFTMTYIENTYPLMKLFSNGFIKKHKLSNPIHIVDEMQETTAFIHKKKCLIVDGNEKNYLISSNLKKVYFIDVDNYQTEHFHSDVIAKTIQDYHTQGFSELTDWFAFGIVTFQIFTGSHPYRVEHKDFDKYDLVGKMKNNISPFRNDVTLPVKARPLDNIPNNYLKWYKDIFDLGKREPPPGSFGETKQVKFKISKTKKSSNTFSISVYKEFENNVLYYNKLFHEVIKTEDGMHIDNSAYDTSITAEVVFTDNDDSVFVKTENGKLLIHSFNKAVSDIDINCKDFIVLNDKLILLSGKNLSEISFSSKTGKIVTFSRRLWEVHPNSEMLSNVIYQNIIGTPYLTIIEPYNKGTRVHEIKVLELLDHKVLDARYSNHVCMVITYQKGDYYKFIFRFTDVFSYDYRKIKLNDIDDINFVVLDSGYIIHIHEYKIMEIFNVNPQKPDIRVIEDKVISDIKLTTDGSSLKFIKENRIYDITMN